MAHVDVDTDVRVGHKCSLVFLGAKWHKKRVPGVGEIDCNMQLCDNSYNCCRYSAN
jgi:hypothetical protein